MKSGFVSVFVMYFSFALANGQVVDAQVTNNQASRIYIANDDHTDYMWTANADTYSKVFVDMIDWHLNLADQTANNPSAYRNRFNCDGSYWLWNYQQKKTPQEFARLINCIKDGTISAPLNTLVSCYGGQPAEAVLRGMYYSGRLERKYDLRFPLAVAMENQTLPLGLSSLFAGAGAKYSWRGVCGCATKMNTDRLASRPHEIYWWTGHDGQRVLLKWHSLDMSRKQPSGGYGEAFDPTAAINYLDSDPTFLSRYRGAGMSGPYSVRAAFGFGWDALDRKTGQPYAPDPATYPVVDHFHDIAQQQSNAQRQVIVSNEKDFFEDFENSHGQSLPSQTVTYGNEWDLYSSSMSETSARVKRAVEKLRTAELMATLVSLQDPDFTQPFNAQRDEAFVNIGLYWEHNWTADGPISRQQRANWQEMVARNIESYVDAIYYSARDRLDDMIAKPNDSQRFFVLNPLSWLRTEHADIPYTGDENVHVRDLTSGRDVPHQFCQFGDQRFLRILATNVPSVGYKVFEIQPGPGSATTAKAATFNTATSILQNPRMRLSIERDGSIKSFVDRDSGNIELAANIDGLCLNDLAPSASDGAALEVENNGPVSTTVRARSQAGLNHETTITVYYNSARVDVENLVFQNFSNPRFWTFSFAVDQPAVRTEEVGAVNLNKLKADGGAYADSHARYDFLTVNHFADITDGTDTKGMTISNPDLAFGKLGHSSHTSLDTSTPQLSMLAGGQVDGANLGITGQNGNNQFLQRFALRPHGAYNQTAAMKFSLEHQNPLIAIAIPAISSGAYPETNYSLLSVSDPNVLLWAVKPSEEGIRNGMIARFWNVSHVYTMTDVTVNPVVSSIYRTTHIETNVEPVARTNGRSFSATFNKQQMQTYRLNLR